MKQAKSINRNQSAHETLDDSLRFAATNILVLLYSRNDSVKEASTIGIPLIEICNNLLLCNDFNDALSYFPGLIDLSTS